MRIFHEVAHWCGPDERRRRRQRRFFDHEAQRPSLLVFGVGHEVRDQTDDDAATMASARDHRRRMIAKATLVALVLGASALAWAWNRPRAGAITRSVSTTPTTAPTETQTDSGAAAPPATHAMRDADLVAASTVTLESSSTLDLQPAEHGKFAPVLLEQVLPDYPAEAGRRGLSGLVAITYMIDATGRPTNLVVTKSVPGLDEAALAALKKWRYAVGPFTDLTVRYPFSTNFVIKQPTNRPAAAGR